MKKFRKLSIMTLLTVFLLSLGATSAFADNQNLVVYESEPNNSHETSNTAVPYNWNWGVNYGYIGYQHDSDFWHLASSVSNSYEIQLTSPSGGYNYDFLVVEKVNGEYVDVARSNAGLNQIDTVTVPGLKPGNIVPDYYILVYDAYGGIIYNAEKPYTLVIFPS